MTVIGITGPTGAGKTTVLNVLVSMGGVILDCDAIYHDLTVHCEPMRQEMAQRFGGDIFDEQGVLKRKALGAVVFDDPGALADLNEITHRYVRSAVKEAVETARREGRPAVGIDAIALFEGHLAEICDCTVAVIADDEVRVRRIMAREGISEEYARLRIAAQKSNDYFQSVCHYTLVNNSNDRTGIEKQVRELFHSLIKC